MSIYINLELLKPFFSQVHGVGGLVLTSFPELEKQGGNLIVESILRGIRFAANRLNRTSFRNIYVQLDNCSTNKCTTVIAACALLVKLGICKKIKVNYLEVGHTHEDIDALIGTVVSKLRMQDLRTFEDRINAIKNALNEMETGQVKDVQEVIGITDYEEGLNHYLPDMSGLTHIKEFRITANEEGDLVFLYKSNSTIDGWLPKPLEKTHDFTILGEVFKHPNPNQGFPVSCEIFPGRSDASAERGKRQHWFYKVEYALGDKITWPLKCIGIPIKFPDHIKRYAEMLPVQKFSGLLCKQEHRDEILHHIRLILHARSGENVEESYLSSLTCFYRPSIYSSVGDIL